MGFKKYIRKKLHKGHKSPHDAGAPSSESATPSRTRPSTPAREELTPHTSTPQALFPERAPLSPSPSEPAPSVLSHSQSPIANASSSSSRHILQTTGKVVLKGAQVLKESLDGVPDLGILKGTLGGLLKVIEIVQQKHDADTALQELDDLISELSGKALQPLKGRQEIEIPPELKSALINFAEDLRKIIDEKILLKPANDLQAYVDAEGSIQVINGLKSKINMLLQQSIFTTQLATTLSSHDEKMMQHIRNLRVIPAAYNSGSPGNTSSRRRTRSGETAAQALKVIDDWIDADSGPNIMIVHGLAGTGKSTIAQTIAEQRAQSADSRRRLGASFFFSRDQTYDHKAFFPTIAYQLAGFDPSYVPHLGSYLGPILHVEDRSLQEQVSKMFVEPLSKIPTAPVSRALIVLDALDEFDKQHASLILDQLLQNVPKTQLKVLITCRLEPHLKDTLKFIGDEAPKIAPGFKSENMLNLINPEDIRGFIHSELSTQTITDEFPGAPWNASDADESALVRAAGSLFIVAATMIEFIKDKQYGDPETRRQQILDSISKGGRSEEFPYSTLDRVYVTILRSSLPRTPTKTFLDRYRLVVGSIICLQQPLSSNTLAALINMKPHQVDAAIRDLTSVIHRHNGTLQVYHASFADFLLDWNRCVNAEGTEELTFYIDADERHACLAELCLDAMSITLTKSNILNLSDDDWFKDRKDQNVTEEQIGAKISPQLQYACRYWASHFSQTSKREEDMMKKLEDFATERLLFWIEALSWTGHLADGLSALLQTRGWNVPDQVRSLYYDCQRLLMMYYEIIKNAPLHLYSSALPFLPSQTSLFRLYKEKAKKGVEMSSGQPIQWDTTLAVLHGHTDSVTSVAFSPDGNRLASASDDRTIRLWDGVTGKEIATLNGHTNWVTSIAFSPDGNRLASASNDNTVRLWDGVTGKDIATLNGHLNWVTSVAFSPGGNRLASASSDTTVRLWDGMTGKNMAKLNGHTDEVRCVTFSPDGNRLASASHDNTVRLWDGVTGKDLATLNGHTNYVTSVTFSPDGNRLASASGGNTVRLWDGVTGKEIATLNGHTDEVRCVTFSPNGNRLASASYDRTVRLWDGVTGKEIATLNGHTDEVRSVAFSPDSNRLASASNDNTVRLWDGVIGKDIATLNGHTYWVTSVAFSPDVNRLASASRDNTVRLWDGVTGKEMAALNGHTNSVTSIAFSPDGNRLASASSDNTVRLWDGVTGKEMAALNGHTDEVRSVTFSPDGNRLASASHDNTVRLWDGVTGKEIATLNGHMNSVTSVTFSPDGNRLASASNDNTVRLWDGVTGKDIATLNDHMNWVTSVAFSPDSNRLASASGDNTVRLWDGVTGKDIATLDGHTNWVISIAFSPDGNRLASASNDNTVRLWDGVTGKDLATLNGHTNWVTSVAFSPDGNRLASASADDTVRLWDGVTGKDIATLNGHTNWVTSVAFSPDGNRLASASYGHTVRLWDVVTGDGLSHWPVSEPPSDDILPIFFSQTLFLPSTIYAGLQPISLLSCEPPSLGPPLFWLPPWFKVHRWWLLPTGGLFMSNQDGKVLFLAPVVNSL